MMFANLFRQSKRDPLRTSRPAPRATLRVEQLEDRLTPAITLTFEGLKDFEPIAEYYNGGSGGQGSGPGPSFGVSFSGNALALTDADNGGNGNFGGEPSSPNIAFFLSGGGALTMNVPAGFERGFSFYYTAINSPGFIRVYDGLNATGNVLAILSLPLTPFNGAPDPTGTFSPFLPRTVEFNGTAKSVDFGGTANQIGFDNITLGPLIEIQDHLQKKTDAVKVATLISETGVLNAAGSPTAKFNKLDNDRFFIVIDDKSIGAPQITVDQIEVRSIGRDGTTVLDSLAKLRLNRQTDGRFASQPLILVADAQDDAFGGNEGTENDLTIQAEAGGKLKIKYKDPAGTTTEKEIDVSRPAEVKKIVLNVTYLNGLGYTEAGIRAQIARASKLFSQSNAYLEVKAVKGVADPGGLADLDEFTGPNTTAEERQLLAINRDADAKVVNAYFVRSLSNGSSAEAFPAGYFTDPADAPYTGSLVVTQVSNYKTVGHELLHLLFNNGDHATDRRRLIYGPREDEATLLKKRILRTEGTTLLGSGFAQAKESLIGENTPVSPLGSSPAVIAVSLGTVAPAQQTPDPTQPTPQRDRMTLATDTQIPAAALFPGILGSSAQTFTDVPTGVPSASLSSQPRSTAPPETSSLPVTLSAADSDLATHASAVQLGSGMAVGLHDSRPISEEIVWGDPETDPWAWEW